MLQFYLDNMKILKKMSILFDGNFLRNFDIIEGRIDLQIPAGVVSCIFA